MVHLGTFPKLYFQRMFKGFGKSKKESDSPVAPLAAATNVAPSTLVKPNLTAAETAKSQVGTALPKTEANTAQAPASQKTGFQHGLLSFKLLETKGLKVPPDSNVTPGGTSGKDVGCLPFAVIELDKNEVIMRSVEVDPIENTVIFQTKANLYVSLALFNLIC